ncbi:Werner syndrome ATP-dependent helicase-like, partial [Paramuricea clavata]
EGNALLFQRGNQSTKPNKDKATFKDRNRPDNNTGEKSGKLAFIAGDSILQHVHGWELSSDEQRVSVKAFSGSSVEDMQDYIKPLIRKKPDTMILHVGTNDIKDDTKSAE